MRLRKIVSVGLLALLALAVSIQAESEISRGAVGGLSQATADGLYGSLAGEAAWGGAQDFTLATLIAKAATADTHVVNRLFGDGRWAQLAAANTFTKAAIFNGDVTLGDAAGDTVTSNAGIFALALNSTLRGLGVTTIDGTTWDFFTDVDNVTVPNANATTEAMNQQTADARYAELSGHVITGAHVVTPGGTTLDDLDVLGDTGLGNAVGDRIDIKAGIMRSINPLTWDVDGALSVDASGFSVTLLGINYDFTGATRVLVPDAAGATEAINQQTGDARYVLEATVEVYFNASNNSNIGDFSTDSVSANGTGRFRFAIPADFDALVSLRAGVVPAVTNATADIDLTSDYGAIGESFSNHSESDLASTYNLTANELQEIDISGVFSVLAAGDRCGLAWIHNSIGGAVHLLWIQLRYTRP